MFACEGGHLPVVRLLVEQDGNDSSNETILMRDKVFYFNR
jgi:hypothetical protein